MISNRLNEHWFAGGYKKFVKNWYSKSFHLESCSRSSGSGNMKIKTCGDWVREEVDSQGRFKVVLYQ